VWEEISGGAGFFWLGEGEGSGRGGTLLPGPAI